VPEIKVEHFGVNVQVVGQFNPRLFLPQWFGDADLIRPEEVEQAKIGIVHEEICQFSLDWLNLQVTQDRLLIATSQLDHAEVVRDLAVGVLTLLSHTPTSVVGINHDYWLDFPDQASWDEFGWRMLPPQNWGVLSEPGMALATVQGLRTDGREGYVRVSLHPQLDGSRRVRVNINDHYLVSAEPSSRSTEELAAIVGDGWYVASEQAETIVNSLMVED
jgi:hypothetical protein